MGFKLKYAIIVFIGLLTVSLSSCSQASDPSYSLLQGQGVSSRAEQARRSAARDTKRIKSINKELDSTIIKLKAISSNSENQLLECEKNVKKLGVRVSPR